nr:PEPxxWA-CTERM sorting domain-containing protein [uncultured Sphingosinicella sp.]
MPEPSTWAMLIVGFGAVGMGMRSSRRRETALAAA